MCVGGPSKQPQQQAPAPLPTPAPMPTPTPSEISPQSADEARRRRIERQQYGYASTLTNKGGARGLTGTGPNLTSQNQTGKQKLGV